jgi:hypothetical protein
MDTNIEKIENVLDMLLHSKENVRVFFGDENGQVWDEEHNVFGRVGKSTGTTKIWLLCHPKSRGGVGLSTKTILGIKTKTRWLYRHPNIDFGQWSVAYTGDECPSWEVRKNKEVHCRFPHEKSANRYVEFMTGKRMVK